MRRSGFTLLELVVAMALFIVLLGILWNVVSLAARTQSQGTRLAERSQLVRSLAQLLEDDLRAAIQDPIHPHTSGGGDDDIRRFGLSGTSRSLRIDVIEINPFAVAPQAPRIARFGEIAPAEPKAAELKTVFYDFQRLTGLSRRELDFETPGLDTPGPEGSLQQAPEVVDCRFRYFNGTAWSDHWESLQRDGLPVAIEATLRTVPLADALRLRKTAEIDTVDALPHLTTSRIVAYLPASPVRKFETYRRQAAPKKEDPMNVVVPPTPIPPPPSPEPASAGPQQSWIRGE